MTAPDDIDVHELVNQVIEERVAAFCLPVLLRARHEYEKIDSKKKRLLPAVDKQIAARFHRLYYGKEKKNDSRMICENSNYAHLLEQLQAETSNAGSVSEKNRTQRDADKKFIDWLAEAREIWAEDVKNSKRPGE